MYYCAMIKRMQEYKMYYAKKAESILSLDKFYFNDRIITGIK